jgi:hypothetical protein
LLLDEFSRDHMEQAFTIRRIRIRGYSAIVMSRARRAFDLVS